ncbi:MAG: intermembrane transport protein PqiB [Myxococcota bacterium]
MSEKEPVVAARRRIPAIWLVPIVAFALGIWMVVYTYVTEGPEITITFSTAAGIEAGKTKIKALNVEVGLVDAVTLNEDLESVTVVAKLVPKAGALLRDDSRLWVVRPRFGAGGISGLGTIMSGAYIELEPGSGAPSNRREFQGLDDVPVTAVGTPGLRIVLSSKRVGSVGTGNPVLYRGFRVGRVESTTFDPETQQVHHSVFIDAPYDELVDGATRFWNASGISFEASADGMRVDVGSLQTLLSGGVAFGIPDDKRRQGAVENGTEFVLHSNYPAALEQTYRYSADYVVSFSQSVRGLSPGAPVEYRGLPVGRVRRVMLDELAARSSETSGAPIPILISLEPGRMGLPDTQEAVDALKKNLERAVSQGGRASLESGNLLTGSLLVSIDFYPEEGPAKVGSYAGYPMLPTLPGGLERIERNISRLLTKLNDLPLEETIAELNGTLAAVRETVDSEEFRELPSNVSGSLANLDRTLRSVERLSRTVGDQPNSIIFSRPIRPDPEPRARP